MDISKEPPPLDLRATTRELIQNYDEVNGPLEEFSGAVDIIDLARHIRLNRPIHLRGGCAGWPATSRWNASYLQEKMGGHSVKVAQTPLGNADSPVLESDGVRYFVQPSETEMPFEKFFSELRADHQEDVSGGSFAVSYSQAQNDNLRSEYHSLYQDVPSAIPEMSQALDRDPDAINFWLGTAASVTSLHRDNYENIYAQIRGSKTFTLIPPVETACVNEQFLPCASYVRGQSGQWSIEPDSPEVKVPVAIWDPDHPEENATDMSTYCHPYRVRLEEGDMLYLPACWYHKVVQENGPEGFNCSVNYWYDMDFNGPFHSMTNFVRQMAWALNTEIGKDREYRQGGDDQLKTRKTSPI